MWSKMDSELDDIARIGDLKWNAPLSGCYEAPSNFRSPSVGEFLSDGNISIVPVLDFADNAIRIN